MQITILVLNLRMQFQITDFVLNHSTKDETLLMLIFLFGSKQNENNSTST